MTKPRGLLKNVICYALALPVLLFLGTGTARADLWQITFSGDLTGTGSFTTNGACSVCSSISWLGGGIETFTASLGSGSHTSAFDISEGVVTFTRSTDSLNLTGLMNGNGDLLAIIGSNWYLTQGSILSSGGYSVSDLPSTPEPASALMLSMLMLGIVGWRMCIRAKV